jgi:hypothetical protein
VESSDGIQKHYKLDNLGESALLEKAKQLKHDYNFIWAKAEVLFPSERSLLSDS